MQGACCPSQQDDNATPTWRIRLTARAARSQGRSQDCRLGAPPPFINLPAHSVTLSFARTNISSFSLRPNCYAKRLKACFRQIVPSHSQTQKEKIEIFSVRSVAVIISYDVIRDVFLFCLHLLKRKSKFDTSVSAIDNANQCPRWGNTNPAAMEYGMHWPLL